MKNTIPNEIIGQFREAVISLRKEPTYNEIVESRDAVLARYQPVFSSDYIPDITEDEFRSFLEVKNNRHWSGLHRQGPRICSSMDKLRKALSILVDEEQHVDKRLNDANNMVSGMGKNIATAILMITNPECWGVWNNRSEGNLKRYNIWPKFDRGDSFGKRYEKVNKILLQLRDLLQIDLWTLDSLWWYLDTHVPYPINGDKPESTIEKEEYFGLEKHLHEFLRDNWNHLELGKEWEIFKEPGDDEAGYEYPCDVGKIDILAKHKREPKWLVIELKRNQTSDQTVGQLLRYIGWVKQNLAEKDDKVHGLIICHKADENLQYALSIIPNAELRLYEVEFHLKNPKPILLKKDKSNS